MKIKLATSVEKVPANMCKICRLRSSCVCAKYLQDLYSSLIHCVVSSDSVSGQWRPLSDCMDVQADQSLHCLHIPEDLAWRSPNMVQCMMSHLFSGLTVFYSLYRYEIWFYRPCRVSWFNRTKYPFIILLCYFVLLYLEDNFAYKYTKICIMKRGAIARWFEYSAADPSSDHWLFILH